MGQTDPFLPVALLQSCLSANPNAVNWTSPKQSLATSPYRPILDSRVSPNRTVSQIQILKTGGLQSSHWRHRPIGQEETDVGFQYMFGYLEKRSFDEDLSEAGAKTSFYAASLWAMLIARIYEVFPLVCPQCGGELKIVAFINETDSIQSLLSHIGELTRPPPIEPARAPPDWLDADMDQTTQN